jgi:hypothetical protein
MRRRPLFLLLGFVLAAWFGYWLAGTATTRVDPTANRKSAATPKSLAYDDDPAPRFRREERGPGFRHDDEAANAGALRGQRILIFKDQETLERFLKRAGDQVRLLGRLDALNALRVGVLNPEDLADLLGGDAQASLVYPVNVPPPPDGKAQPGAIALRDGLLDWLGVTSDNSAWGNGVKIAILDTGVTVSPAFNSSITVMNLVDLPADPTKQDGHGTAVASMIIGQNSLTPGVAPGASILSIRIADDLGQSDSFLLAKGIIAAVDAGAQLINISMGSQGDSGLVQKAIEYARAAGALIIAAAGNNGIDQVAYPAANRGVIGIGAVEALGNHLDFSNTGSQVAMSAPGYGINAAWTEDQAVSVSGTSFSSPIVTASVAVLMSQLGLSPQQAYDRLVYYSNDGGAAGVDSALGVGMPALDRALKGNTPSIYDAAVASQRILPPSAGFPYGQLEVLVQNRGTETLINTTVSVTTSAGVATSNITLLPANGVQTVLIPISQPVAAGMEYGSKVSLSSGTKDAKPSNNSRAEKTYAP